MNDVKTFVLLSVVLCGAYVAYVVWSVDLPPLQAKAGAAKSGTKGLAVPTLIDFKIPDKTKVLSLKDGDIFHLPSLQGDQNMLKAIEHKKTEKEKPVGLADYVVDGIVWGGEQQSLVILKNTVSGQRVYLKVGAEIGGWKIYRIQKTSVVLRWLKDPSEIISLSVHG